MTGIVGSPSVRDKNYSTESILADRDTVGVRDSDEDDLGLGQGRGHGRGQERGGRNKEIHIATEVRVERGPRGEGE